MANLAAVCAVFLAVAVPCRQVLAEGSFDRKNLVVPKPKASDGKYTKYVLVKWTKSEGAAFYKVRRATSKDYSKSKVIATVTGTSYKDKKPAAKPKKKYYYWVVPYVAAGEGKKSSSRYDSGYVKQEFNIANPIYYITFKGTYAFKVTGNSGVAIDPESCKWKITKGSNLAGISKRGVLNVKHSGTVIVRVTYNGETIYLNITLNTGDGCCSCGFC